MGLVLPAFRVGDDSKLCRDFVSGLGNARQLVQNAGCFTKLALQDVVIRQRQPRCGIPRVGGALQTSLGFQHAACPQVERCHGAIRDGVTRIRRQDLLQRALGAAEITAHPVEPRQGQARVD